MKPPAGTTWPESDGLHVDVRGLPPPEPFVTIMRLVVGAAPGAVIIVHHDREPFPLYAALAEQGWGAAHIEGEPGEVRLRLARLDTA